MIASPQTWKLTRISLLFLYPASVTVHDQSQFVMAVVLAGVANGDKMVLLSSDDSAVVDVPASVTVLDGDTTVVFPATAGIVGSAQITAILGIVSKSSNITVVEYQRGLKPTIHDAMELKPKVVEAKKLTPAIIEAADEGPGVLKPKIHDAAELKPTVVSAKVLKPKIYDTEES